MSHMTKLLIAASILAGVATAPASAQRDTSKPSNAGAATTASNKQNSVDEFEENRRAHMEKSKENNAKKGEQ